MKMVEEGRLEMAEEKGLEMVEEKGVENLGSERFHERIQQQSIQKPTKMVTNKRKAVKTNEDTKIHIVASDSGVADHASFCSREGHLNICVAKGGRIGRRLKPRKPPKWLPQIIRQSRLLECKI